MAIIPVNKQYGNGSIQIAGQFDEVTFNPTTWGSLLFNGSNGYLEYYNLLQPSAFCLSPSSNPNPSFTLEFWAYYTGSYSSTQTMISSWQAYNTGAGDYHFDINTSGYLSFTYNTSASSGTLNGSILMPINQWAHIAITRDASNVMRMFVNGTLCGSQTVTGYFLAAQFPKIGANDNSANSSTDGANQFFSGYMTNLRAISGVSAYTSNFTPPTAPFQPLALTAPLAYYPMFMNMSYNATAFIDTFNPAYPFTSYGLNGTVTSTSQTPFSRTSVSKINSNGTFQTGGVIDEHTTITGAVSKSYSNGNLGISGSFDEVTINPNAFGSLKLTGNNSYLSVAANSSLVFGSNPFTIEAWVYPTLATTGWSIYDQRATFSTLNGIYFQLDATSNVAFRTNNNTLYTGNLVATLNTWTHVALTKNSSNVINVWVNGQQSTATLTYNTTLSDNSGIYIGRTTDNNAAYAANGYISNLRVINGSAIYTAPFTPPTAPASSIANTVLLLNTPNSPAGYTDFSNNNFTVTKTANVTPSSSSPVYPPGYYSYYFNGNSVIETSSTNNSNLVFGTSNYTIDFWFNPISNGTVQQVVWYNSNTAAASPAAGDLKIAWGGSGANSYLQLLGGSSGTTSFTVYNPPYGETFDGTDWWHIAIVRNGSGANNTSIYNNGILYNSFTDTTNYTKGFFTLGGARTSAFFTGYISNFRIVNGIAVYTNNFVTPTSPTLPVSNTVILTAQSNRLLDNGPGALGWTVTRQFTPSSNNNPFLSYTPPSSYSFVTNTLI